MSRTDLKRTIVELSADHSGRIYYDRSQRIYPSVTTVLNYRDDPGKEGALEGWRQKYDGKNGAPYHEHIGDYSRWRGTLIHWYILHYLNPDLPVTDEERDAMDAIEQRDREYDFIRSIALTHDWYTQQNFPSETEYWNQVDDPNDTFPVSLTELWASDTAWAAREFANLLPDMGLAAQRFDDSNCKTLKSYFNRDVRRSQIHETEQFIVNEAHNYAGQFDCLYENADDEIVLMDIKTGKSIYWDYPRQLEAYARALEQNNEFPYEHIDTLQIARLKPDNKDVELSTHEDWGYDREQLWNEFKALAEQAQSDTNGIDLRDVADISTGWFDHPKQSV